MRDHQRSGWRAVQLDKLTRIGTGDEVDFVEDDLGLRGERQTAECGEQSEKLAIHGERCEWGSKVAYLFKFKR